MIFIDLPVHTHERLSFYLAMEEYIARQKQQWDDCFFMWQVNPSVIFGRNQLIDNEVNVTYCKSNGIEMYRRKSGGGCVYADMNNIMMSYINSSDQLQFTFYKYVGMVAGLLQNLGLDAKASLRNDIMIGDKKVSGNAFYHLCGRNIVHGTMLYDTNMDNMINSITPNDTKLQSKGVKSVRQHITLLKDHLDMSLESFKLYVSQNLCEDKRILTDDDVSHIHHLEEEYLSPDFIYGKNPKSTIKLKRRLANCGNFETYLELTHHKNDANKLFIKSVNMVGDFFLYGDLDGELLSCLKGCEYTRQAINQRLNNITPEKVIMNLTKSNFIDLLF